MIATVPGRETKLAITNSSAAAGQGRINWSLCWIFLAAVLLRLMIWVAVRDQPLSVWDEREYDTLARSILERNEYSFVPGELTSLRPPLYPALVAFVYSLTEPGNYAAVRLLQGVLSLVTAVFVFALAKLVVPERTAALACALFAFYPSLLGYNNLLLTETLFTLFLVMTCYFVVRSLNFHSIAWALAAGLALGFAALTRSIVWLAPPFIAVYLTLTLRVEWQKRLISALALVCGFVVVVAPWSIRNTRLQQTFIAIDTMGGRNFMMGNYQYTPLYRSWDAIALQGEKSWDHEVRTAYPPEARPTQGFVDKLALKQGLQFVKENPGLTLKRDVVKFFDFWGLERELIANAVNQGLPKAAIAALATLICGAYAIVLLLGIYGLLVAPPIDRRVMWLFFAVIMYICALHTISFGHSRYHLPLIPFMGVFAANAISHASAIWQQRWRPAFMLATSLCVVFAASWIWIFLVVDRSHLMKASFA